MKKPVELSAIFYRKFLLLIVIPILIIIIISMGIIQTIMTKSSLDKIGLAQKNIKSTLENEILDSSLRLSHFLLSNNNQILEYAAEYNMANDNDRYAYSLKIKERFNLMMMPKMDILDFCIFMKDGSQYDLKGTIVTPSESIRSSNWYKKALEQKKLTYIGSEMSNVTYYKSKQMDHKLILVVALSPGRLDKYNRIEMTSMHVSSQTTDMVKRYNNTLELGTMYIVDGMGKILTGMDKGETIDIEHELLLDKPGVYNKYIDGKKVHYIIDNIETTDWKIINIVERHKLLKVFYRVSIGIISISILLFISFFIFSRMFLKNIIKPVENLVYGMELMEQGDLSAHVEVDGAGEIRKLTHSFNKMVRQIKELILSNEQKEQEKHQEEIKALQSQINPHFLVNTLNSIRFIAMAAKFDSIKNMAEALTKILSCSFRSENSFYSVADEIGMLESYVYLMKIRYSDNFKVNFEVQEECQDYMVPRLIIQPIVENSIVHGFQDLEDIGTIHIRVSIQDDQIIFDIKDDGKGMTKEEITEVLHMGNKKNTHRGIGISNVNRRIQLNYGEQYGIKIYSKLDEYTQTIVRMPLVEKGDNDNV